MFLLIATFYLFHPVGNARKQQSYSFGTVSYTHLDVYKRQVLYVPTYRESDTTEKFEMDYQRVISAFEKRYRENWIMLIRIHPKMREKAREIVPKTEKIVDVSLYPDIQELMVVADALITDYSSAVFDFILTYKPGFIYAINEQRYDIERGLYLSLIHI